MDNKDPAASGTLIENQNKVIPILERPKVKITIGNPDL